MSIRDQILEAQDRPSTDITIPEWGGVQVRLRGMSGKGRADFLFTDLDENGERTGEWQRRSNGLLLIQCLFDPSTDERLFDDDDVDLLLEKSAAVLDRLVRKAQVLSGIGDTPEEKDEEQGTTDHFHSGD